jgi:acetyltransferase-like isoleucine patch superfamily enzyme
MIEKIIRKLKNDPHYKWESQYATRDLLAIALVRGMQVCRGLFLKLFLKESKGLLFVGSGVKLRHKSHFSAGKNLILEDNVFINALSEDGITMGDQVSIARDSILICTGVIAQKGKGISIGQGTGINAGAYLGGQGGIRIGEQVIIGPGVQIFSENHNYDQPGISIKEQGVTRLGVSIGDHCWLGGRVTILDGVHIGKGCVVAAGSVVTKSCPDHVILAGVPARVIKSRS